MDEEKWLAGTDPQELLELLGLPFVSGGGFPPRTSASGRPVPPVVSERKVFLFLAACARGYVPSRRMANRDPDNGYERKADDSAGPVSDETGVSVGFTTAFYGYAGSQNQCNLLRCVFGNPFRPLRLSPSLLTPTVLSLAQASYEERIMPQGHLDPMRLAVLADALEELGGAGEAVGHLRSAGPHVRGCHVVDAVSGRG
jgi:hypothetical protein